MLPILCKSKVKLLCILVFWMLQTNNLCYKSAFCDANWMRTNESWQAASCNSLINLIVLQLLLQGQDPRSQNLGLNRHCKLITILCLTKVGQCCGSWARRDDKRFTCKSRVRSKNKACRVLRFARAVWAVLSRAERLSSLSAQLSTALPDLGETEYSSTI